MSGAIVPMQAARVQPATLARPGTQAAARAPAPEPEGVPAAGIVITELASLPETALLDEAALARALRCTPRTIQNLVRRFALPPPLDLAGNWWLVGTLRAWLAARGERLARDAEREARRLKA
jgi:hypothetical protein